MEAYRDLSMEQALQRREQVQDGYWRIMDQLEANRADSAAISQYIFKLIQEGLSRE